MTVKIKTWEALETEFGLDSSGNINLSDATSFTKNFNSTLPIDRTIKVTPHITVDGYFIWKPENTNSSYLFSSDIIEEYFSEDTPKQEKSPSEIFRELPKSNVVCHYVKFALTDNISIRYFYSHSAQPDVVGKFALKDHNNKTTTAIPTKTAGELIAKLCTKPPIEIIGRRRGNQFIKTVLNTTYNILNTVIE